MTEPQNQKTEADSPRAALIFLVVVVSAFMLTGLVLAVDQLFGMAVREEIAEKVLRRESTALRQLHSDEQAKLTRYQWVDSSKGVVRIPIDRAMELTLRDWSSRATGFVAGTPAQQAQTPTAKKSDAARESPKRSAPSK